MAHKSGFLQGKMLIAAPGMLDPRFAGAVVYMCGHDQLHAAGLVINHPFEGLSFSDLTEQLKLETPANHTPRHPILNGGPVEPERGFILHDLAIEMPESTMEISANIGLSSSKESLQALVGLPTSAKCRLLLGISSWEGGQIEQELQDNSWLICEVDDELLFGSDFEGKWEMAMAKIGVDPDRFSDMAGHA